ncbi:MAG: 2-oxo acid dehydrogenase subunit E2 [bacterium]|nr:2-oxo acid dehydrogenase subunit E2 [bacterium]
MATNIIMPQGGQDLTEGTVVSWLKHEGEPVEKDEIICEVETEKAVFEVAAPCDGTLLKIMTPAGEIAKVLSTIGCIGEPGEQVILEDLKEEKQEEKVDTTKKIDISAIRKRLGKSQETGSTRVKASGKARKIAKERGLDLADVQGTGPGGRITEKDLSAHVQQPAAPADLPVTAPVPPAPAAVLPKGVPGKTEPMSKMRKIIAQRLQRSKQTIPHFYVTVTVEMTEALKLRQELNEQVDADSSAKISVNDMIVRAAALALEEFYQVNCMLRDDQLLYLEAINIGVAVSLDDGLVVPVLPDVDVLSLKGIAQKSKELFDLAKSGKHAGTAQASFTISNMGMMDVENFAAIINPPESAILAVSSVQKGVVVSEKNDISIRDIMKMTISADHRVVDGVLAAKFVNKIKYHLQNPKTLSS